MPSWIRFRRNGTKAIDPYHVHRLQLNDWSRNLGRSFPSGQMATPTTPAIGVSILDSSRPVIVANQSFHR